MMQTKPNIGDHVLYPGNEIIGECSGRIEKIYDGEPGTPFNPDEIQVRMRPDVIPNLWPYDNLDVFGPRVAEIEPISKGEAIS